MKIGIRKPSLKKSVKARTTGKIKRATKKAINPTYGKKGMGLINNPKKAVYNKAYNQTSFSLTDKPEKSKKTKASNSYMPGSGESGCVQILALMSVVTIACLALGLFLLICPVIPIGGLAGRWYYTKKSPNPEMLKFSNIAIVVGVIGTLLVIYSFLRQK